MHSDSWSCVCVVLNNTGRAIQLTYTCTLSGSVQLLVFEPPVANEETLLKKHCFPECFSVCAQHFCWNIFLLPHKCCLQAQMGKHCGNILRLIGGLNMVGSTLIRDSVLFSACALNPVYTQCHSLSCLICYMKTHVVFCHAILKLWQVLNTYPYAIVSPLQWVVKLNFAIFCCRWL